MFFVLFRKLLRSDAMQWLKSKHDENNSIKSLSNQSLHHSIKYTLILGQVFGLMPVNGITSSSEKAVRFEWKSWRVYYAAIILLSTLFPIYITFYRIIFREISVFSITALVFYGNSFAVHVLFLVLAQNWENLMKSFYSMEMSMRTYSRSPRLNLRLKLMTFVIMGLAFTEHILVVTRHFQQSAACATENEDMFQYFFVKISFPQIFKSVPYNIWLGFYLQFIVIIATFSWTYIDLFIMLMSSSIAVRFRQVTGKLASYVETRVSDEHMWRCLREDYNRLCRLCRSLNQSIANIVLVSFSSNLFFILIQFFNSLRHMENLLEKLYFFFSFGLLIGRTVCVSLYGAWINDESQKPLQYLNAASSSIYNTEIRRFILHVCFDSACLSGKRYFNVTRQLILSIAGTIVAYELVLIQFYGTFIQVSNAVNVTEC